MATFYSVEYGRAYESTPAGSNYAWGSALRTKDFTYVQAANGTAADTINLVKLPPYSTLDMFRTWFEWSGWTSGATLSIGWRAYVDADGAAVALSAAGLLSAIAMTVDGAWVNGMLVVATPDDSLPVVGRKVFNNKTEVTIYATIGTQAPGAADIFNGSIGFKTP